MHSSLARHDPAPSPTGPADLACFVEPDGAVGWINPDTRSSLLVEPSGVFRVSRYEDGFDYVVVLGQLCATDTAALLDRSAPDEGGRMAWELIQALDGAPRLQVAEAPVRDAR